MASSSIGAEATPSANSSLRLGAFAGNLDLFWALNRCGREEYLSPRRQDRQEEKSGKGYVAGQRAAPDLISSAFMVAQ
jgi:hypothetical protein